MEPQNTQKTRKNRFLEKLLDLSALSDRQAGEQAGGAEVAWLPLGKVVSTVTAPAKVKKESYRETGTIPIIDQGASFIAGYTDEDIKALSADEYVIFGDHSEHIKYVDFAFIQGADGLKILKPNSDIAKYVFYAFLNFYQKELNYKRHWSRAKETLIPIPCPNEPERSLAIQGEIVRILDAFTELTAELTARKKQYNHYRDQLLTFEEGEVEWKTLGEVAILRRGRVMSKGYLSDNAGEYPVYSSQTANNGMIGKIGTFDFDGEYVSWTTDGANAGTVFYRLGRFSITNVCGVIKSNGTLPLNLKFIFYWLSIEAQKHVYSGMGNPKLMSNQVAKIPIPIPYPTDPENSLAEQARIVAILDKFDALTSSISEGLPREIALREKQYEYYRDLLLSFPKPEEAVA